MSSTAEQWRAKRRRRQQEDETEEDPFKDFDVNASSTMTAAKRLRMEREQALQMMTDAVDKDGGPGAARMKAALSRRALASVGESKHSEPSETKEEQHVNEKHLDQDDDGSAEENEPKVSSNPVSLLEQAAHLKKQHEALNETDRSNIQRAQDEERILKEASHVQTNALQAASELAEGVKYKSTFVTAWRCPGKILRESNEWEGIRKKWHIITEGEDIPPPVRSFRDMAFPPPVLETLKKKNVKRPTPIQMQGLTVALSGRDMVGIAFTVSVKNTIYALFL